MRALLMIPAAALGFALPAAAQPTATTRIPPAPNASSYTPQPSNSLPDGAITATRNRPGTVIDRDVTGTTGTTDTRPAGTAAPASRP